jgi:hypothetical protein
VSLTVFRRAARYNRATLLDTHTNLMGYPQHISDEFVEAKMKLSRDVYFAGALKGAGDTFFILIATTTISIVYVTLGRLGQVYGDWGLFGW